MKLYGVAVAYEGIYSVFSTEAKAKAYIETHRDVMGWDAFVVEIELDNPAHEVVIK